MDSFGPLGTLGEQQKLQQDQTSQPSSRRQPSLASVLTDRSPSMATTVDLNVSPGHRSSQDGSFIQRKALLSGVREVPTPPPSCFTTQFCLAMGGSLSSKSLMHSRENVFAQYAPTLYGIMSKCFFVGFLTDALIWRSHYLRNWENSGDPNWSLCL
ncbi:hypothetical protein TTRE_0000383501 [Trichuris trichiura]|uniref:Uncharacterized protein n=1 Tax=Trichuris trichiura TaxID=36087 RepID=A0A077Z4Y7_TRITR|nr:hypothetical protein TTRE_0000383501 [Trichuris trichiura]